MTLAVGTKLDPYEIVSPLGAGGMGEVYRARDARLLAVISEASRRARATRCRLFSSSSSCDDAGTVGGLREDYRQT
jgi:hypothetical protein